MHGPETRPVSPDRTNPAPRRTPTVGRDAECEGCGYNLRGVQVGSRCPECGLEVARSVRRTSAATPDAREAAAETVRTLGRSWLLMAPLGVFAMGGCLAGPASALAVLGSIQRLIGLRACRRTLREVELGNPSLERTLTACTVTELVLGVLGVLLRVGGDALPEAVPAALHGLHFGAVLLSAVPTAALLAAIGRAVDDDAQPATAALPWLFGAAAGLALAIILLGVGLLGGVAWAIMVLAAAAWAWGASMLAFAGSTVAGEVGMPRRRSRGDDGAPAEVEAPAPRPVTKPADDSPIPY